MSGTSDVAVPRGSVPLGRSLVARVRDAVAGAGYAALPFVALAAGALVLRLVALDAKPLHHDEAQHAWFAWRLVSGEGYSYDPVFHGPVQFYLIALSNLLFGVGDFVARVGPATMGSIAVFLPFLVREQLGRVAALTASVALCLSPSFLYFSRFAREDINVACVTLALVVLIVRFLDAPRRWHPSAALGVLAVSFATKETTFITGFVFGTFALGAVGFELVRGRRRGASWREAPLVRRVASLGLESWIWGVCTFLVVFTLLFSTFLTSPAGLQEGLWGSIDYWLGQQDVNRGGQPWFYYFVLLPAYEWPVIILGLVGVAVALRRPTTTRLFLLWMFVLSLAVYSWASERMPWLILHPLLPLILLAGIGAQTLWSARRRWSARLLSVVVALAAVASTYAAVQVSYFRSADPRELLVQVQTADDVPGIRDELLEIQAAVSAARGEPLVLEVDSWGGTGWPWSWYLRDVPVGYYDMSKPGVPLGPVLLVADPNHATIAPRLKGYEARRFTLRVWWVPEYGDASPRDWVRWAIRRRPWNSTATMEEWLFVRRDVAALVRQRSASS